MYSSLKIKNYDICYYSIIHVPYSETNSRIQLYKSIEFMNPAYWLHDDNSDTICTYVHHFYMIIDIKHYLNILHE